MQKEAGPDEVERINQVLERVHLQGIERDAEAAIELQVEQARLTLYGSLAIAGGAVTTAWGQNRAPCMPNLQLGLVCLMAAVLLAWPALIWATTHRKTRVTRKYLRLQAAQAQVFEGLYPPPAVGELEKAEKHEALAEGAVRWLTQGAYIFATGGAGSILVGVIAALGHRGCYVFTVWPLTEFN